MKILRFCDKSKLLSVQGDLINSSIFHRLEYGDVWGKTVVVKTRDIPSDSERSLAHFFLEMFLGTGCIIELHIFLLI